MQGRYTEDELIARCFAPIAGPAGLGLADDAAFFEHGTNGLVLTADMLVAGVHFFEGDPPALIAKKALRVNLSDLAAKGAEPVGFLLSLALPRDWTNDWLKAFAQGLGDDARQFACPLLGGDTSQTPGPLTISITALGDARGKFVSRGGARPGDAIYVTGTIGDAALGLALRRDEKLAVRLSTSARDYLLDRYLLPQPRGKLAPVLRDHASAAMDVSDGLAGDLAKMMRASKASAVVDLARVPLSDAAREAIALQPDLFDTALTGGDDYEILFCASGDPPPFEAAAQQAGVRVTKIGEATDGAGAPVFRGADGNAKQFSTLSFSHF